MENDLLTRTLVPCEFDPETVKRKKLDVPYGTLPAQKLDLYYPETGEGPWPLVIFIHGGGWFLGSKRQCPADFVAAAHRHGYAFLSVDYRLYPSVRYPEFLFDVKTAVRWARANAAEYALDPERFAVMGDSSGAHLSLMVAFSDRYPECEGTQYGWADVSSRVQAVADLYGPVVLEADNLRWAREAGAPEVLSVTDGKSAPLDLMMAAFTEQRALLPFLGPLVYVHKEIPPVLILHGEMDSIVPIRHSTRLAERIRAVCGEGRAELRRYPGRVHSDRDFMNAETAETIMTFFDKILK